MLSEEQKKYIRFLKDKPYLIGIKCGFVDFTKLHNEWLKLMIYSKKDITLQAHRGSFKSSCLSVAIALHMILYPTKTILFFRKTDSDVKESIRQTAKILQSEYIRYIVYKIYNMNLEIDSNQNSISTNLYTTPKGSPQLLGLGIRSSITGKHADLIITDDIINLTDRISKAERESTKMAYQELINIKNRNGRMLNIGTPWHKDDAFSIMPEPQKYDCYSTGLISKEQLEKIRNSMTPTLFSANYELKHIADENALFKDAPKFFNDKNLLAEGIGHIDASYGGEDGSAFTLGRKIGNNYYLYGKLKQTHIDNCLNEFISLTKAFRCGTIYCEKNADKGYLQKEIVNKGHIALTYNETENKFIKISSFLKMNWNNVYFYEDTDAEYISQIMDYSENASHDDAPDSASCVIRKLNNTLIIG